jgi:flagellin
MLAVGVVAANNVPSATAASYVATAPARSATVVGNFGDIAANDLMRLAVGPSGGQTTFTVQILATETVDQIITKINAATAGRVVASYDDRTGTFNYQALNASDAIALTVNSAQNGSGTARTSAAIGIGVAAPGDEANALATDISMDVRGFDLRVGGNGAFSSLAGGNIATSSETAATMSASLDTMLATVNANLATLGSQAKALETQREFLTKLSDTVEKGVGQLVDADLAKESARLKSLQIKQQLSA